MTIDMTIDQHLAHLLHLMQDYPEGWKAHCWHRAKELAQRPELADLPAMLKAAVRAKATSTAGEETK